MGDSSAQLRLLELPDRGPDEALGEEFDREVLDEALARVRPLVPPRDWDNFQELTFGGRTGTEVARERNMTLPAVGMVKLRVQRKVAAEVARLDGRPGPGCV